MIHDEVDWAALERLRRVFLEGEPVRGSYWRSRTDLASYDATLGERIGWKWDAVLAELAKLSWRPPPGPLVDFGCGSGVAGRRVVSAFGPGYFSELRLSDKSPLAETFAQERARQEFPDLRTEIIPVPQLEAAVDGATLAVSHVLSELTGTNRDRLRALAQRAAALLWVEPGAHADSRALIEMREALLPAFVPIAPCSHEARCGLQVPGNERHWCHFFAATPWEVFADPHWAEFARRLGIDLRSLPFSYLVMERRPLRAAVARVPSGVARVIGEPRFYKAHARLFCCTAAGVSDLTWPKRDAGALFKTVKNGAAGSLFHIEAEGESVKLVEKYPADAA